MTLGSHELFSDRGGLPDLRVTYRILRPGGIHTQWFHPSEFLLFTIALEIDWYSRV